MKRAGTGYTRNCTTDSSLIRRTLYARRDTGSSPVYPIIKKGDAFMAKGVKTRNIDSFREGLMEYAYGRCSQAEAVKIAGMSVPTFRKYANMHF